MTLWVVAVEGVEGWVDEPGTSSLAQTHVSGLALARAHSFTSSSPTPTAQTPLVFVSFRSAIWFLKQRWISRLGLWEGWRRQVELVIDRDD